MSSEHIPIYLDRIYKIEKGRNHSSIGFMIIDIVIQESYVYYEFGGLTCNFSTRTLAVNKNKNNGLAFICLSVCSTSTSPSESVRSFAFEKLQFECWMNLARFIQQNKFISTSWLTSKNWQRQNNQPCDVSLFAATTLMKSGWPCHINCIGQWDMGQC